MVRIPEKLKRDSIAEGLFEIRFQTSEVAEVILGKIATRDAWSGFLTTRLPLADFPQAVRDNDKNLRDQPLWQLQSPDGKRVLKVGPRVFSVHAMAPYPGWGAFEPELISAAKYLFQAVGRLEVLRYGFRYINVLTREHMIESLSDLNLKLELAGEPLSGAVNLNYSRKLSPDHVSLVRVAPPELIENPSAELRVLVDVDIYTPSKYSGDGPSTMEKWLADAHQFEKVEFFKLLPQNIIDQLEGE